MNYRLNYRTIRERQLDAELENIEKCDEVDEIETKTTKSSSAVNFVEGKGSVRSLVSAKTNLHEGAEVGV